MTYNDFYKDIYNKIVKLTIETKSYELNHVILVEKDILTNIKIDLLKNPNIKLNILQNNQEIKQIKQKKIIR
jgi:hypothetical protein